ncbi:glucosaminidase [Romboutsia weinsteinii]|uniref:Glucosaminidase n=1 Tax=Romboutsia weinsteinii TaxID=2020949 RepID=A0A371J6E5_9FIRM|nr:glucosaminidase domain-containing protein [Romboutsia weinsteinii]RDY28360.1 glucosaminidase [Romboutsia weinsteinii]
MSKKKIIAIGLISTIVILASILFVKEYNLREIKKNDIDVSQFIITTDELSEGKAQINWKNVASIIGVLNNNNFKNTSENDIKDISKLFLEKSKENNEFFILQLDEVISKLDMTSKQSKRVKDYINDLEHFGLMPERLDPNDKYAKFINTIKNAAKINYEEHNILPSITISQAILESNWGESELSKDYNNLFGIKAHSYWKGESVQIKTSENFNDVITDKFRVYKNQGESIDDHAKFLKENPRYKNVFDNKTYISQAKALEKSGYSTVAYEDGTLKYKDLLVQIIRQYNLQLIDSEMHGKKAS